MISLSLLPKKTLNTLRRERIYQHLTVSLIIFLIGLSVIALNLWMAKNILEDNLSLYKDTIIKKQELIKRIQSVDAKLKIINDIQSEHVNFSEILVVLSKLTPPDCQIKNFIFNKEKKEFTVKGWAKTRQNLLDFQNNLSKSGVFIGVESPLSNFLRQENIDFEFSGKLNL